MGDNDSGAIMGGVSLKRCNDIDKDSYDDDSDNGIDEETDYDR